MRSASPDTPATRSHKPRAFTVFAAAFVAGAAAAVGVNSLLDVRLAQAKPRVESEPIFVALRSLPQGAPVTVWDVALRDWPRAMVPTSALRASDAFSGLVLKHPLREGQPLLSIQLVEADATMPSSSAPVTTISTAATPSIARTPDADLWAPAAPATASAAAVPQQQAETPRSGVEPRGAEQSVGSAAITDAAAASPVAPTTVPTTAVATAAPFAEPSTAPPAEDVVATATAPRSTPADVVATAMPEAAPEGSVDAAPAADETFTDEILEAMAATAAPAADTYVATPDETTIGAPVVAASPSDRAMPPRQVADRPSGAAADAVTPTDVPTPATTPAAEVVATPSTPTLADPPVASIGGEQPLGDDGTARSVMRPAAADAAPAQVPAPPRVARYLVVPENIALQADASFAAARQPAPQQQPRAGATGVQQLPPTARQQPAKQPAQRASQPRRGTSAAASGGPQRQVAPQQSTEQQPRRGMFPNIAAGIETIDAELGRMRRDRADQPQSARPRPQY